MINRRNFHQGVGASGVVILLSPLLSSAVENSSKSTAFNRALEDALSHEQDIKIAASERKRGIWESAYYEARPLTGRPAPSLQPISDRAKQLIIRFEVSNKAAYSPKPVWPGGQSGITIGIGYDIGYVRPAWLREDWSPYLSQQQLDLLSKYCKVTGARAGEHVAELQAIAISWDDAGRQFRKPVLPMYVAETINALPNAKDLPPDCLGALVSLVYNRGASFKARGPRFEQMRAIRIHMVKGEIKKIPAEIRAMSEIWRNKGLAGLIRRRELEAQLFELGL